MARQYAVCRIPHYAGPVTPADPANPAHLRAVTDSTSFREPASSTAFLYALTALAACTMKASTVVVLRAASGTARQKVLLVR